MPIVPIVQISGKYIAEFNAERLIHGKVRDFTLRSASHWDGVNKAVAARSAALMDKKNNDFSKRNTANDDYVLIAQALNDHSLKAVDFPQIHKGLREFVLAHLIRDVMGDAHLSFESFQASSSRGIQSASPLNHVTGQSNVGDMFGWSDFSRKHGSLIGEKLALIHSLTSHSKTVHSKSDSSSYRANGNNVSSIYARSISGNSKMGSGGISTGSRENLSGLLCLLISCGALRMSSKGNTSKHHLRVAESDHSVKVFSLNIIGRSGTVSHPFPSRDANGFGTAPIWYQQSMATGPPGNAISLEQ
jgi:hypothetical protein